MENQIPYSIEDSKLIGEYILVLKSYKDSELCCALVHFLSKYSSSATNIINKRKLFLLKVLRECTNEYYFFDIKSFPREIGSKLIEVYQEELKQQDKEGQEHIAKLMEEMNEIF